MLENEPKPSTAQLAQRHPLAGSFSGPAHSGESCCGCWGQTSAWVDHFCLLMLIMWVMQINTNDPGVKAAQLTQGCWNWKKTWERPHKRRSSSWIGATWEAWPHQIRACIYQTTPRTGSSRTNMNKVICPELRSFLWDHYGCCSLLPADAGTPN